MAETTPGCMSAGVGWKGQVLEAPNLRMRLLTDDDVDVLTALADDWDVARFTAFLPHPFTPDDAREVISRSRAGPANGIDIQVGLERRTDGVLVGCAGLEIVGDEGEIGYFVGAQHNGHGFATEAVHALVRLAFTAMGLTAVTAEVMADNAASARVLEKAGFVRDGERMGCRGRCAEVVTVAFSMTAEAWAAREAAKPRLLVAAVALIDVDGRVLIGQRPTGKPLAGLWEFPGGKVEAGETPEAALVRELHEELGIDITESCLAPLTFASHAYESFHLLMPLYACRTWQGTVTAREGQALKWVHPARLADHPLPPADIPLAPLIRDFLG